METSVVNFIPVEDHEIILKMHDDWAETLLKSSERSSIKLRILNAENDIKECEKAIELQSFSYVKNLKELLSARKTILESELTELEKG